MFRSERELKEAMALTAGMTAMIDDQVGRIILALKGNGQYDDTVIVFNSDHGDYLGDFNLLLKGVFATSQRQQGAFFLVRSRQPPDLGDRHHGLDHRHPRHDP